jgi:hypothetical protein
MKQYKISLNLHSILLSPTRVQHAVIYLHYLKTTLKTVENCRHLSTIEAFTFHK